MKYLLLKGNWRHAKHKLTVYYSGAFPEIALDLALPTVYEASCGSKMITDGAINDYESFH